MGHHSSTSCNAFPRRGVPWGEMLSGVEPYAVLGVPGIEIFAPSSHARVVFVGPSAQTSEVVRELSGLDFVHALEVTFLGKARALHAFPRLGSLRSLVLKNVLIGDGLLDWIVANPALHSLSLKDVKYNGSFDRLAKLQKLRELEIGGSVPGMSHDCEFLTALTALTSVDLEMDNAGERVLTSLIDCPSLISLKLSGQTDSIAMTTLSSVSNLRNLEFSKLRKLELPRSFQELHFLREMVFTNLSFSLNKIRGLENIPSSVSSLCLQSDSLHSLELSAFPEDVRKQIKHLSLKVPVIGQRLGLQEFPVLESLELYPKKELDEEVLNELHHCPRLNHVGIGGSYLDMEKALEEHFHELNLHSLDISNTMITPNTLAEIHRLSNIKSLGFHCCFFSCFDLSSLLLPRSLESLSFNRCCPIENHIVGILSSPIVHNLRSISFTLSSALPRDQWTEVCTRQRELSAVISFHWMLSEVD